MKQKARIQCNKILNLINELGGVCYLTNKELSDRTGIATRTVERRKLDLLKSGEVRERDNQGKGRVIYILRQEPKSGEVGSIDSRKSGEVAKIAEAKSGEVVTSTKSGHYKKSGEVAVANCVILHKSGEVGPKRIINNIHTNNTYYLYSNPFIVSNDSIKSETQNKEMDSLCSSPFVVYRNPLEKEISDGYEYYQKCVDNYFTSYWHRQYQVRLDLLFHGISKLEPGQIAEVLKNVKSKFLLELLDRKIIKSNLKNKIYRLYRELLQWYKIIKSIPYPDQDKQLLIIHLLSSPVVDIAKEIDQRINKLKLDNMENVIRFEQISDEPNNYEEIKNRLPFVKKELSALLNKPEYENYMTRIGLLLSGIRNMCQDKVFICGRSESAEIKTYEEMISSVSPTSLMDALQKEYDRVKLHYERLRKSNTISVPAT